MADANVALAEGPSSQFINPAALLTGPAAKTTWEAGGLIGHITADLRRPVAAGAAMAGNYPAEDNTAVVPYAAISYPWSERVTVGFSFESPHGLSSEWPDHSFDLNLGPFGTADLARRAKLQVIRVGPAAAIKLNERWAVGGRFFAQHVEAKEENDISSVEGDGTSVGAQVGVRYATRDMILGAAYTTRTRTEVKGSLSDVHPIATSSLVAGTATADILLPARLQAGIAFQVKPDVWWELDLDWMGWAYVDELTIEQSNGTVANAGKNQRDHSNTLSVYTGVKWTYSPRLTLYAGLGYDPSPVAEKDVIPTSSTVRKTRVGVGVSRLLASGNKLELAYQFIRGHSRKIGESSQDSFGGADTNLYEGTYDSRTHIIGVSYTADF